MKPKPIKTTDHYRAVFLECGLRFAQSYGSKTGYVRAHPGAHFIANSCIYTRDGTCVWRGDLDLVDRDNRESLICASRALNAQLFVLPEQTRSQGADTSRRTSLARNAIFTVWRGLVAAGGAYSAPQKSEASVSRRRDVGR